MLATEAAASRAFRVPVTHPRSAAKFSKWQHTRAPGDRLGTQG